jgi:hypothetical protein
MLTHVLIQGDFISVGAVHEIPWLLDNGPEETSRFLLFQNSPLNLGCGLYGNQNADGENHQRTDRRQPAAKTGHLRNFSQQPPAFDKQQSHGDEHRSQTQAEDRHQHHAEARPA